MSQDGRAKGNNIEANERDSGTNCKIKIRSYLNFYMGPPDVASWGRTVVVIINVTMYNVSYDTVMMG